MNTLIQITTLLCALAAICASHGPPTHTSAETYADVFMRGLKRMVDRARAQGVINVVTEKECNLVCPITTVCSLQFIFPRCVPIYSRLPVLDHYYNQPLTIAPNRIYGQAGLKGALSMHGKVNVPLATVGTSYNNRYPVVSVAKGQATIKGDLKVAGKASIPVTAVEASYDEPIPYTANEEEKVRGDSKIKTAAKETSVNVVNTHYDTPIIPTTANSFPDFIPPTANSFSDFINALVWASRIGRQQPTVGTTSKTIGVDMGFGLNNCGFVPPECRAAHNDLKKTSKYSFDYTLNRCVRVNVCSSCSRLHGALYNMFDSPHDCNRFCK